MKKIILVIVMVFMAFGCNSKTNEKENEINVLRVQQKVEIEFDYLVELLESNSDYILYIGRKTCGTCQNFEKFLEDYFIEFPDMGFYYFDTDSIKDIALSEDADPIIVDFYENRTTKLNFDWTPTLHRYVNNEIIDTFKYLNMEYYDANDERKLEIQSIANQNFIDWMNSNY